MRFDNLEEFLRYYYENKVNIGDVEFTFSTVDAEAPAATPDVVAEPPVEPEAEEEVEKLQEMVILDLADGVKHIPLEDGHLVVESFAITPGVCGTGSINIMGRRLYLNMCEMEGTTFAYLDNTTGRPSVPVRVKS
jgi:hypothetical protein